jgi:hypothetical protein
MRFLEVLGRLLSLGLLVRHVEGAPKSGSVSANEVTNSADKALPTHIGRHLKHAAAAHGKGPDAPNPTDPSSYAQRLERIESELLGKQKELKVQSQLAAEKEVAAKDAQAQVKALKKKEIELKREAIVAESLAKEKLLNASKIEKGEQAAVAEFKSLSAEGKDTEKFLLAVAAESKGAEAALIAQKSKEEGYMQFLKTQTPAEKDVDLSEKLTKEKGELLTKSAKAEEVEQLHVRALDVEGKEAEKFLILVAKAAKEAQKHVGDLVKESNAFKREADVSRTIAKEKSELVSKSEVVEQVANQRYEALEEEGLETKKFLTQTKKEADALQAEIRALHREQLESAKTQANALKEKAAERKKKAEEMKKQAEEEAAQAESDADAAQRAAQEAEEKEAADDLAAKEAAMQEVADTAAEEAESKKAAEQEAADKALQKQKVPPKNETPQSAPQVTHEANEITEAEAQLNNDTVQAVQNTAVKEAVTESVPDKAPEETPAVAAEPEKLDAETIRRILAENQKLKAEKQALESQYDSKPRKPATKGTVINRHAKK